MTRQLLLLSFINIVIIKTSFAIDYLDEIKLKYSQIYYEPAPKTNNNKYSEELRAKLPGSSKNAAPALFPSGILPPGILNQHTNYLFSVHEKDTKEELLDAHLDIIRA